MGHGFSIYDSPSTDLKPGTYRIVNVASKTVIHAPDDDRRKVVGWASSTQQSKHQMVNPLDLRNMFSIFMSPSSVVCTTSWQGISVQKLSFRDIFWRT